MGSDSSKRTALVLASLLPMVLLPLHAPLFVVVMAVAGVARLALGGAGARWLWIVVAAVLYSALGAFNTPLSFKLHPKPFEVPQSKTSLIAPPMLYSWSAWKGSNFVNYFSKMDNEGFVSPVTSKDGLLMNALVSDLEIKLNPGTYLQSLVIKTDKVPGRDFNFQFAFERKLKRLEGLPIVYQPVIFKQLAPEYWRAYAIFTLGHSVNFSPMHIADMSGNWDKVSFGFPQLEPTSGAVLPLRTGQVFAVTPWYKNQSMLGYAVLFVLTLLGGSLLMQYGDRFWMTVGLLVGCGIQLVAVGLSSDTARPMGWFSAAPNLFAHHMVMVGVWALLYGHRWLLAGAAWLVATCTVVVGQSRSGIVGVLAGVGVAAVRLVLQQRHWWAAYVAIGIGLAAVGATEQGWLGRGVGFFVDPARKQAWASAAEVVQQYPWFGIGGEVFDDYHLLKTDHANIFVNHTHNLAAQTLVDKGLVGLLLGVVLWGWITLEVLRKRDYSALAVVAVAGVLNVFDYTWYYAGVYSVLALTLSTVLVPAHQSKKGA